MKWGKRGRLNSRPHVQALLAGLVRGGAAAGPPQEGGGAEAGARGDARGPGRDGGGEAVVHEVGHHLFQDGVALVGAGGLHHAALQVKQLRCAQASLGKSYEDFAYVSWGGG